MEARPAVATAEEVPFAAPQDVGGAELEERRQAEVARLEVEAELRRMQADRAARGLEAEAGPVLVAEPAIESGEVSSLIPDVDLSALERARKRAQEELAREMSEALRRAGVASGGDDWLKQEDEAGPAATASGPELILEPQPGELANPVLAQTVPADAPVIDAASLTVEADLAADAGGAPVLDAAALSVGAGAPGDAQVYDAASLAVPAAGAVPPQAAPVPPVVEITEVDLETAAPAPAPLAAPEAKKVREAPEPWVAWTPGAAGQRTRPADEHEDDLWRIVRFDSPGEASSAALPSSFEEALQRIDQNLERLVGMPYEQLIAAPAAAATEAEPPVEAIVEETPLEPTWIGPPPPDPSGIEPTYIGRAPAAPATSADDNADPSGEYPADFEDWPLDEEDVGDPSDPAEAARLRRQRLLRRAMENMGTLPLRGQSVTVQPVTPAPASAPAAPAAGPRSTDERALAQTIEEKFKQVSGKRNHFQVLGVPTHATKEQVKDAFLSLAKVFHPDRLPQSLSAYAPKITSIFEAIREAYDTLFDDDKRRAYALTLQQAASPAKAPDPRNATMALEEYKRGEVYFRKRDFVAAEEAWARAYALDPKAEYLAARGWALYMDPQRRPEAPRAKQMMADALKVNPQCDRAHYQLGVIARVENRMEDAERHFREAVKANPRHLEANQELRLIEMRKKKRK
ncbi:MAG: DnaJ domain-containing protein [Myxococcaceae bacterium]|nr:DnaJ domain-containing protein [Myxococcaceae bacterium]